MKRLTIALLAGLASSLAIAASTGPTSRVDQGYAAPAAPVRPAVPTLRSDHHVGPAAVSVSYTIDASTTAMQTGRMNRDAIASTCAAPKVANPFDSSPRRYVTSAPLYNQSASDVCATITVTFDGACDVNVQPVAYLGSFNPANISENYLGDAGVSSGVPANTVTFEVTVPANDSIVVNLNDTQSPSVGVACTATIESAELFDSPGGGGGGEDTFTSNESVPLLDDGYDGSLGSMVCTNIDASSIPAGDAITSVTATTSITHTWVGDVTAKLVSPSGSVLTLFNRPGFAEVADDGTGGFGDSSDLLSANPLTFDDASANDAEAMGSALGSTQAICAADGICDFFPNAGAAPTPPGSFADLVGEPASGTWSLCVGDSGGGDTGTLDGWSVTIGHGGGGGTPVADVSPGTLDFNVATGASGSQPLTISNTGGGTLDWSITEATDGSISPAGGTVVLYDQNDNDSGFGSNSQDFEADFDTFDNQGADDFTVPTGETWTVTQVDVTGSYFNGAGPAMWFNVFFYADAGGAPGALVSSQTNLAFTGDPSAAIPLTTPVELTEGTYWVSVQARMDFGVGGQWAWEDRTVQSGNGSMWQNPGDGFGSGCPTWGPKTTCIPGSSVDFMFRLHGTNGGGGGGGCTAPSDVPWLSASPASGSLAGGESEDSTITVDASALAAGSYSAHVCVASNDPVNPLIDVPVSVTVTGGGGGVFPPDEFFDEVTAPALPAGWVSTNTGGSPWTTVTTAADSAPNAAFAPDVGAVSDMTLDSPSFTAVANQTVTFRHRFELEDTFDGAVLEISINGGAFQDIVAAGGSFMTGGYTDTISTNFSSPIGGRMAWSGNSGGFITTTALLPAAAAGQSVVLRFRTADDTSVAATGWWVDSIHLDVDVGPTEPEIQVTPTSLGFTVDEGATGSDTLTVANVGGGTLTYSISEAETPADAPKPTSFLTARAMAHSKAIVNGDVAAMTGTLSRSIFADGKMRGTPIVLGDTQISQMADNTPGDEGVSCGIAGTSTADNSWWRRFYFNEHPAVGPTAEISSVTISSGGTGAQGLPFTINLYTIDHSVAVNTIPTGSLTLIGSATGTIDMGFQTVTVPVTGTVADTVGKDLVVEWHTDGIDNGTGSFFPGANATPETHPTFLSSETCGISEPTTAANIGFPDFHLVMIVNVGEGGPAACDSPSDVPWLSVAPSSGSLAGGESADSTVTVDASGLAAGSYSANLCVASNDATTPLVTVPVSLTVQAVVGDPCSAADTIFCDGFDGEGGGGEPGTFDNRTDFLGATAPGYYENPFNDAVPGPIDSLSYTQGGWSYTVDTGGGTSGLYNDTGLISTDNAADSIVVTFTGDPVTAVGGNFWATDISVQPTGTSVTITLSDGTTETFTSTGPSDFRGFTTAAPITSIRIDAPDEGGTPYWATMDNLIVGSAQ